MKTGSTELYSNLILRLVAARQSKGISQAALAHGLSRHQTFVSKYEQRERLLDIGEFCEICGALEISPVEVLAAALSDTAST